MGPARRAPDPFEPRASWGGFAWVVIAVQRGSTFAITGCKRHADGTLSDCIARRGGRVMGRAARAGFALALLLGLSGCVTSRQIVGRRRWSATSRRTAASPTAATRSYEAAASSAGSAPRARCSRRARAAGARSFGRAPPSLASSATSTSWRTERSSGPRSSAARSSPTTR